MLGIYFWLRFGLDAHFSWLASVRLGLLVFYLALISATFTSRVLSFSSQSDEVVSPLMLYVILFTIGLGIIVTGKQIGRAHV